jgi:hypothetical protein
LEWPGWEETNTTTVSLLSSAPALCELQVIKILNILQVLPTYNVKIAVCSVLGDTLQSNLHFVAEYVCSLIDLAEAPWSDQMSHFKQRYNGSWKTHRNRRWTRLRLPLIVNSRAEEPSNQESWRHLVSNALQIRYKWWQSLTVYSRAWH